MAESPRAGGHSVATLYDLMIRMFVSSEAREKANLEALKELIRVNEERALERAAAQDKAVAAALTAAKESSAFSREATQEATKKQETSEQAWRDSANEWRGAMSDRERDFMPRVDCERRLAAIENFQAERAGAMVQMSQHRETSQWVIGLCVGIGIAIAGIAVSVAIGYHAK